MGTSIDLNRCVSTLLGKLDANNQGHKKSSGCDSVKIYVCIQTRTKAEPKQNRKTVGEIENSAGRLNDCMLLFISIHMGNCPIKKT